MVWLRKFVLIGPSSILVVVGVWVVCVCGDILAVQIDQAEGRFDIMMSGTVTEREILGADHEYRGSFLVLDIPNGSKTTDLKHFWDSPTHVSVFLHFHRF